MHRANAETLLRQRGRLNRLQETRPVSHRRAGFGPVACELGASPRARVTPGTGAQAYSEVELATVPTDRVRQRSRQLGKALVVDLGWAIPTGCLVQHGGWPGNPLPVTGVVDRG